MATETLKSHTLYSIHCGITGTVVPRKYFSGPFPPPESTYSCKSTAFVLCKRLRRYCACSKACASGEQTHSAHQHTTMDIRCSKLPRKACLVTDRQHVTSENRGRMALLAQDCIQRRANTWQDSHPLMTSCWGACCQSSSVVHHVLKLPLPMSKAKNVSIPHLKALCKGI